MSSSMKTSTLETFALRSLPKHLPSSLSKKKTEACDHARIIDISIVTQSEILTLFL